MPAIPQKYWKFLGVQTFGCNIELDVIVEEQQRSQRTAGETIVYIDRSSKSTIVSLIVLE